MSDTYFVTTPIYYVNGAPHIGHAYTSVAADVLARFNRLDGKRVFFLTGTDEHGQKVEKAARDAGLSPSAYVDQVAAEFRAVADTLGISFDAFIRTSEPRHARACAALWKLLADADQIYSGSYEGWYSIRDEAYYGEDELSREADGSLYAPTGASVEWVSEPSYFFRLSSWQTELLKLYEEHPEFLGPASKRNEVISFVRSGLKDLSISRTSFSWGIPVPGDPAHVMYVWFDALVNYLSALDWPTEGGHQGAGWLSFWPADLHLVGKEIARFHAVYWPAFLMAAGLEVPRRIFSHGWWTVEGEKISKSVGNGVDPRRLVAEFGLDPVRFFLLREVPFGRDGDYSRRALIGRMNVDLANDLGNLAQRVLSMVARQLGGIIPDATDQRDEGRQLVEDADLLPDRLRVLLAQQRFGDALDEVWRVVRAANVYVDRQAPWALAKTDRSRMGEVLGTLLSVLRAVGVVLQPFMPGSMESLLDQLSVSKGLRSFSTLDHPLAPRLQLPRPRPIFPRFVEPPPPADLTSEPI